MVQDYGDGGAYPECAVAQYPLGLGKKSSSSGADKNGSALAVQLDAQGKVKYDVLAKQGHHKDKVRNAHFYPLGVYFIYSLLSL